MSTRAPATPLPLGRIVAILLVAALAGCSSMGMKSCQGSVCKTERPGPPQPPSFSAPRPPA